VGLADRAKREFLRLPPGVRRRLLHRVGRFAPWEPEFDFTPPPTSSGEIIGPPDFVGIGAQKAGTTWWYELISRHPDVSNPSHIHKERHFFDRFGCTPFGPGDVEQYQGWFPRPAGRTTGEWTPDYIVFPWAPELLARSAPMARLLVLLRDPVERLHSGLDHQRRMNGAISGLAVADATQRGFYLRSIENWLRHFSADQLLILQYERCVIDTAAQLRQTFRHLHLDDSVPLEVPAARADTSRSSDDLDGEVRRRLVSIYEDEVRALSARFPVIDLALWPNFSHLADGSNSPT
jgi:Sulfotransferase domain